MTELLGKLFIKNYQDTEDKKVRGAWGTLVSVVGIILNILLFAGKFTVGTLSGAISIAADAYNNLSDAGSQLISLVSFRLSSKPADRDHPFGHARIEYVASMIVSFLILHIGYDTIKEAIGKIIHPEQTAFAWISVAVLGVSILVKLWIALFNKRVGKKLNSSVMEATASDSISDVIATSAVLLSQLVLKFTGFDPDAYLGVIVALLILWAGIGIMKDTMNSILGEAPDPKMVQSVVELVLSHEGALGVHDMMAHNYGPGCMVISLHVEVDGDVDIFDSHEMIDDIENEIRRDLGIMATIHMDPIVTNDEETNRDRTLTAEKMKEIDERLMIHDFRMVKGKNHINLIYDISTPFELKMTDAELCEAAAKKMREADPRFRTVITIDRC